MTLSDKMAYRQIIGGLMINPLLFLEYPDIEPTDFDIKVARICFLIIKKLFLAGAEKLTPIEVDQEVEKYDNSLVIYKENGGLDFLKICYEFAEVSNFDLYYTRLKKYSLLRRLYKEKYDISDYYIEDKDINNPLESLAVQERFDEASVEDILNNVEGKFNAIRSDFTKGTNGNGSPANNLDDLMNDLASSPNIGPDLEGKIFSSAVRGAREGCFYLKSASSGSGKSRTFVYDACHLCYPIHWSHEKNTFIREIDGSGALRKARKVLFIVTEMDIEELQTIILSYLSGVNEEHILTNNYALGEKSRVDFAIKIIKHFSDYFFIETISDPNLINIETTIKKYATIDHVKYVFFDYIHTAPSLVNQFARSGLREDVVLMMMANQLKQLAKDYKLFVFSGTQVNATAMGDNDGEFKNETSIRASKSITDKSDVSYVMTRVSEKNWNSLIPTLKTAARQGYIDAKYVENPNYRPTHVIDIYKMRRGRYKNVRIWINLDLGTGRRTDLFMTTADNQPIGSDFTIYTTIKEECIDNWNNDNDIK